MNFGTIKRGLDILTRQNQAAYDAWSRGDDDLCREHLRQMAEDAATLTHQITGMYERAIKEPLREVAEQRSDP